MPPPEYERPADFLDALAKRLHTSAARIPAERTTEELLTWLEVVMATGRQPPLPFLQVAARLVYEQARLVLGPTRDEVDALAQRLVELNRRRPQARSWSDRDWRNLARLVLENRRLPAAALFRDTPPDPACLIENIELPFAARYVEDPPDADARRLASPPVLALLERAEELLLAASSEAAEAKAMLDDLRAAAAQVGSSVTRRPPCRSDSAHPSQRFCKSRSNSAK